MKSTEGHNITQQELPDYVNGLSPLTQICQIYSMNKNITRIEMLPGLEAFAAFVTSAYCNYKGEYGRLLPCPAKEMGVCGGMIDDETSPRAYLLQRNIDINTLINETLKTGALILCNPLFRDSDGTIRDIYRLFPEKDY